MIVGVLPHVTIERRHLIKIHA